MFIVIVVRSLYTVPECCIETLKIYRFQHMPPLYFQHVNLSVHSGLEKPHCIDIFTHLHMLNQSKSSLTIATNVFCMIYAWLTDFFCDWKIWYLHVKSTLIMITTMTLAYMLTQCEWNQHDQILTLISCLFKDIHCSKLLYLLNVNSSTNTLRPFCQI